MNESKSKLILVDDHPLLRKGVRQLLALEDDMEVVGEASNGRDAVELVKRQGQDVDLVLLDLSMKGVCCRIVVFTVSDESKDMLAAFKAGADGYLLKDMEPGELVERIRDACIGKMVLSHELTEVLAKAFRDNARQEQDSGYDALTRREKEILRMVSAGLSNKLIGRELDIAEATVKVHVKHLLKKMGLRSRVEAAVWAVEHHKN